MGIQLEIVEDYEALSRKGADIVVEVIRRKPDAAMVLATGNSPIGLYRELAARYERGEFDTSRLRIFQLDGYLGLSPDDPRSLYGWMERIVLRPLGIPEERIVRLPGDTASPEAACSAYEEAVAAAGGFDFSLLGLGPNGHLGFNEPPSDPASRTRVVDLTESSIASNAPYWGSRDEVPRQAMTAGLNVLLAARQTLLVVSGAHKRDILRRALEGPISPEVPASYLRQASGVVVLADRAAWPG
jgi:glucosamine-6-phosphate deaminase